MAVKSFNGLDVVVFILDVNVCIVVRVCLWCDGLTDGTFSSVGNLLLMLSARHVHSDVAHPSNLARYRDLPNGHILEGFTNAGRSFGDDAKPCCSKAMEVVIPRNGCDLSFVDSVDLERFNSVTRGSIKVYIRGVS